MIANIPVNKPISRLYVFVSFDPQDRISFSGITFPEVEVSAHISLPFAMCEACFLFSMKCPFQFLFFPSCNNSI